MFNKVKYSSLNELIYEEIKAKIINNELKPNEKLDVDFLSNSLGVSRTPVTNALKSLNKDGYVIINPRSGSYVRELSKEELSCIFNFREALESQVIREVISIADMKVLDGFGDEFRKLLNIEPDGGLDAKKRLGEGFFRSHRGFLVNLREVYKYDATTIQMKNGDKVYLAKQKYNDFVTAYMKYLRSAG